MTNKFSVSVIDDYAPAFQKQNEYGLLFEKECLFAKQQLLKNSFCMSTAGNNQTSLKAAILNVAAVGISLNPASAHAYLVPRDGSICLDMSYKGLVKLATDSGAIKWAKAVLVYDGDEFIWHGVNEQPTHNADVFDPKRVDANDPLKNLKGGYCLAQLSDGEYMVDTMSAAEILAIRDSSKAKNGPWKGKWAGEMAKKTLVKRAYKSWPQSGGRERLDQAVEVLNEHEGIEIEQKSLDDYMQLSPQQKQELDKLLTDQDPNAFHLWYNSLEDTLKIAVVNIDRPRGEKGKFRELIATLDNTGRENLQATVALLNSCYDNKDIDGAFEILDELSDDEMGYMIENVYPEAYNFIKSAKEGAAA